MALVKVISYNVNGIRAAIKKGFDQWVADNDFDIIMLQEVKANEDQVELEFLKDLGYHINWNSAQKKGYSGVATLSRIKPDRVIKGFKNDFFDAEGRVLRIDIGKTTFLNAYFPSGTMGDIRQEKKYEFLDLMFEHLQRLRKSRRRIVLSGDYNIAHDEIDIHNPKGNKNNSGFLPEERKWMTKFFEAGFIDVFRHFQKEPHHYSWWSYRANARNNNKGWRIDYHSTTKNMKKDLVGACILPDVKHSDHCPIQIDINI